MWYCVIIINCDVTCLCVRKLKIIWYVVLWDQMFDSDIATGQGFKKRGTILKSLWCYACFLKTAGVHVLRRALTRDKQSRLSLSPSPKDEIFLKHSGLK